MAGVTVSDDLATLRRYRPWRADMPKALGEFDAALDRVEAEISRLERENRRLETARRNTSERKMAAEAQVARLRDGLRRRNDLIRMSTAAFDAIAAEAPRSADGLETGGALFGFDAGIYGPTLITHASGPGPNAVRERNYFLRDLAHTEAEAAAAYADCCARWIGEWHTHPEGPTAPSKLDITSYRNNLNDPELGFDTFLSLIVLPNDSQWQSATVVAWELDKQAMWMRRIDRGGGG